MDKISIEARSRNMSRIRSKDTKPEVMLKHMLFSHGFRYRTHYRINRANVDIAFPKKRRAINVNGCFWHQHDNCVEASKPRTNSEYWKQKLIRNKLRDQQNSRSIEGEGWKLLIVWECELENDPQSTFLEVERFLTGEHDSRKG